MSEERPSRKMSRRAALGIGMAVAAGAGAGWVALSRPTFAGSALSVNQAYEATKAGKIFLVDIRRPDEWKNTGVAAGAYPIDMRRRDFVAALDAVTRMQNTTPIALICARGVRSAWLSQRLIEAGYTNIINVPEGMLGSRAGPGWIKSGLPVRQYKG